MISARHALPIMHLCVVIWGFTAILGKLITLEALPLVWWRCGIVVASLLLLPRVWRQLRTLSRQLVLSYAVAGVFLTLHWLTFYGSIKLSNASVAATCMALAPTFIALLDPLLQRRAPSLLEVSLGLITIPGVALVVGGIPDDHLTGVGIGALSAALVAVFAILNKRHVDKADPLVVTVLELGTGFLMLSPWMFWQPMSWPSASDAGLLLVLGWACTLVPFLLSLLALRHLSAFTSQLTVNLEPIYAIGIAAIFLDERKELSLAFYLGVAIVLGVVFVPPLFKKKAPESSERTAPEDARATPLSSNATADSEATLSESVPLRSPTQ